MKLIANFELNGAEYSVPFDTDEVESATDREYTNEYYVPIATRVIVGISIAKYDDGSLAIDSAYIDYFASEYEEKELFLIDCKLTLG